MLTHQWSNKKICCIVVILGLTALSMFHINTQQSNCFADDNLDSPDAENSSSSQVVRTNINEPTTAVLISGLCRRFIYRDQPGMYFDSIIPFSVYIVLHCGKEKIEAYIGDFATPPYMQTPNLTDIKQWFQREKGAQYVEIRILDDDEMSRAVDTIKTQVTKIHTTSQKGGGYNLTEMLLFDPRFRRWEIEFRKLYARHVVYQMALANPLSHYSVYLYLREDNYFLRPLPTNNIRSILVEQNDTTDIPVIIVDEPCEFGSYSDKLYIANRLGADLLFGSQRAEFFEKMKRFVLFAYYRKEWDGQPLQPEAYVHDSLSTATVVKYNTERVDVRYIGDQRCIPFIYFTCMPNSTQDMAKAQGLSVCEKG